jgi:ATP-dependent DNA ligase
MAEFLAPYRVDAMKNHPWGEWTQAMPGSQSRWSAGKDLSWEPLRPELVVEVAYDHMQGRRFRHIAQFRRWRFDKQPNDCTWDQLEVVPPQELSLIFGHSR